MLHYEHVQSHSATILDIIFSLVAVQDEPARDLSCTRRTEKTQTRGFSSEDKLFRHGRR